MKNIYLGSMALEKNRWAEGRKPSYKVSDFLERAVRDGFSGIELWENHYMLADVEEQRKLADADINYIFNSYLTLKNGITDHIIKTAEVIKKLGAVGVKYNFEKAVDGWSHGSLPEDCMRQVETLLRLGEILPNHVKLLCECHPGTLMEEPEMAAEVFERLDERFGAIVHLCAAPDHVKKCFECYGGRICHVHASFVTAPGRFDLLQNGDADLQQNLDRLISQGYGGTLTLELVKNADSPEGYYTHAQKDFAYLKRRNGYEN